MLYNGYVSFSVFCLLKLLVRKFIAKMSQFDLLCIFSCAQKLLNIE